MSCRAEMGIYSTQLYLKSLKWLKMTDQTCLFNRGIFVSWSQTWWPHYGRVHSMNFILLNYHLAAYLLIPPVAWLVWMGWFGWRGGWVLGAAPRWVPVGPEAATQTRLPCTRNQNQKKTLSLILFLCCPPDLVTTSVMQLCIPFVPLVKDIFVIFD